MRKLFAIMALLTFAFNANIYAQDVVYNGVTYFQYINASKKVTVNTTNKIVTGNFVTSKGSTSKLLMEIDAAGVVVFAGVSVGGDAAPVRSCLGRASRAESYAGVLICMVGCLAAGDSRPAPLVTNPGKDWAITDAIGSLKEGGIAYNVIKFKNEPVNRMLSYTLTTSVQFSKDKAIQNNIFHFNSLGEVYDVGSTSLPTPPSFAGWGRCAQGCGDCPTSFGACVCALDCLGS